MSDSAAIKKLAVIDTIKDGIGIGVKNIGPILVNIILWVLTVWIPYLNVGTTIGLFVGIVSKASKGETIPMTEIFDPSYRKYMGEFFLTSGLIGVGTGVGMALFVIPGMVISIAWSLALLLAIDKGKNPSEAISLSNKYTYGYKGKIFCINILISIAVCILALIFSKLGGFGVLLILVLLLFTAFICFGIKASIYKQLTEGVE